jgi:hypothetical protein
MKSEFGLCSWCDPRQCQSRATHYHHAFGTVCGYHSKHIETLYPNSPSERCKLLKGPLPRQLGLKT